MKNKQTHLAALACVSLIASAAMSQAALTIGDIISVNLTVPTANTPTGAAVIGQSGDIWTEINGGAFATPISASPFALNTTTGASSGASLAFTGDALSHGNGGAANLDVFESGFFLDAAGGAPQSATITLSGLGAGTIFDLYLYGAAGHTAGEGATFNFGSVQTTTDSNVNETSYQLGVNYVKYSGLVANGSGNFSGTWTKANGSYSVLNGMQIAVIPEPSAALLGSLGLLALLRRRR